MGSRKISGSLREFRITEEFKGNIGQLREFQKASVVLKGVSVGAGGYYGVSGQL